MPNPILYGAPLSPFVRKVAVVLEEKGVAYDWNPVRPHYPEGEFKTISPLGKIPAYRDDKIALADSSVICFYLEKAHPKIPLYPTDTPELVRALWFEEYFDGAMITPLSVIYFQQFWNPEFLGKPTDENALKEALEVTLPPMFSYLESQLKPDEWMVGNRFSIADISLTGGFLNLQMAGWEMDAKAYPKLARYIRRAQERPSFQKIAAFTREFLADVMAKKKS
jgi:glutathione S-transferase